MMTLGRWYYLVSVLRTLRHNGVKEFAHNLTPNEWVQLQLTLHSKPRSFFEGIRDISRHRLHKMNLSILREVWRDTSLWKHNLNCALGIRIELAACKAQGCIHEERLQVPGSMSQTKMAAIGTDFQSNQTMISWCQRPGMWIGVGKITACFHFPNPSQPAQGQLSAAQRDMRVPDGLNTKGIWYTHSAEGFFHYSLIQWSLAWQRHLDWKGD